jgi:hypothetical protein
MMTDSANGFDAKGVDAAVAVSVVIFMTALASITCVAAIHAG